MATPQLGDRNHEIKIIWATARRLGIDDDMLHQLVMNVTGLSSIAALNDSQRARVIRDLFQKGRKQKRPDHVPARHNVVVLASMQQQLMIKELNQKLGWAANPDRLAGFCKRVIYKDSPTTSRDAQKIIEALKSMISRNYGREAV